MGEHTKNVAAVVAIVAFLAAAFNYATEHAGLIGDGDPEHAAALLLGSVIAGAVAAGGAPATIARRVQALCRTLADIGHDK